MADAPQERCPICLDRFEDPVVCADGHAYCRLCVGRWVGGRSRWRSVRSNQEHEGACALVSDFARNAVAVETVRAAISAADVPQQTFLAATARGAGGAPCATPEQASDALQRALAHGAEACDPHVLLELAARCDRLGEVPGPAVLDALDVDRLSALAPLLQLRVLKRLLSALRAPASRLLASAVARHLRLRACMRDAVLIPSDRGGADGVYYRAGAAACRVAQFETVRGDVLRVSTLPSAYFGPSERHEGAVVVTAGGGRWTFRSEDESALPRPEDVWALRRRTVPFPDYSGEDLIERAAPPCCTIFEEALTFLPLHFGYDHCAQPCRATTPDRVALEAATAARGKRRRG